MEGEMEVEMEMSMRASEDMEMGEDITPPLSPLTYSLHDAFLLSHCSSCFSPLLDPPHLPTNSLLYCSPRCCSSSSLHVSTAELHLLRSLPSSTADTSDLRAALRLLQSLPAACRFLRAGRIAGLLTNRDKLLATTGDDEFVGRIREGTGAMAAARKMRDGDEAEVCEPDDVALEAALCLVLTNAVEVHDNTGRTLGIAVYGPSFCWINHSCSPNACYRISLPSPPACCSQASLRIVPCARHRREAQVRS